MRAAEATDLTVWAAENRDMVPHIDALTEYASQANRIIEFGVRGGVSTWAFLDGLPPDGRMWSVDIEQCEVPDRVVTDDRWQFVHGSDLDEAVQQRLPANADLVFIDTSHEYRHTVAELEFALTRHPSRILCHDADWPGVAQAIEEFCAAHGWAMVTFVEASDHKGTFSLAALEPA